MHHKIALAAVVCVFMLAAVAVSVHSASEAPKEPVKISGVMFIQWLKEVQRPSDAENRNGFDIQRVYVNVEYKIDDVWSTRATIDVANDGGSDQRYGAYLKYGYVQAAPDLGFGKLTMQFGMIGTSVIGFIDKHSDYRWLNENFINASKLVLHSQKNANVGQLSGRTAIAANWSGQTIDTSADLGVSASLALGQMVMFDFQLTNGEGYKKTDDIAVNDDGKAYLAMLTVSPLEGLYMAGYMRYLITDDTERADNYNRYYGGSLIYVFREIRVGVSIVAAEVSTLSAPATDPSVARYMLFDAFLMANLKSLAGVPVLLAGRYVMGATKYEEGYTSANGMEAHSRLWALGAGYQFNDYIRAMVYFEEQNSASDDIPDADWNKPARNLWIKAEAKF